MSPPFFSEISGLEASFSDEEADFHRESCSPVAGRREEVFIYRKGIRRLRRTGRMLIEEMKVLGVLQQQENRLAALFPREELQPIHIAAHLGASGSI